MSLVSFRVPVDLVEKETTGLLFATGNIEAAKAVGRLLAERAIEAEISEVVFDRAGFPYHGRVRAVAEVAREAGLRF